MKKSELKEYIKDRIRKSIEEASIIDPNTPENQASSIAQGEGVSTQTVTTAIKQAKTTRKPIVVRGKLGEADVNELARPADEFRIVPDFRSKAENIQIGGPISSTKLNNILDILDTTLEDTDVTTLPKIAQAYGVKQSRLYPTFAALKDAGALIPINAPEAEEDEIEGGYEGDEEEDVEVTDTEIEDTPDFEPEPEPEATSFEKTQVTLDPITKDANVFVVDNSDLIQSLINNYKNSRSRIAEIRDESDSDLSAADYKKAMQQSKEVSLQLLRKKLDELVAKISRLEPEVQDSVLKTLAFKFKSVDANKLFDMVAKKLGKTIEPDMPSDEETIDFDDEEITEDSGVEDIDHDGGSFKDYDSIYERMRKLVTYKG